jgi:radical SAM protein with 4Fe4S-binding SPASM domain
VYPCVYAYGYQDFIAGNIIQQSTEEIWKSEKWNIFRGNVKVQDLYICKECILLEFCSLKVCRLKSLVHNGDFYGKPYNFMFPNLTLYSAAQAACK